MKRVEKNDPVAIFRLASSCQHEKDYDGALKHLSDAAAMGNIDAHYFLGDLYLHGRPGDIEKDVDKAAHHWGEAAIGGHPEARYDLGCLEWNVRNNRERAVQHLIIASKQGHDEAIKQLKNIYKEFSSVEGLIKKEDFASALRGHQAAVSATKSTQRDMASKLLKTCLHHSKKVVTSSNCHSL